MNYTISLEIAFDGPPVPKAWLVEEIEWETNPAILTKVNAAFAEIAQDFGWHIVKANTPIEDVQAQIMEIIKRKITIIE